MWVAEYRGGGIRARLCCFLPRKCLGFSVGSTSVLVLVCGPQKCLELSVWVTIIMVLV